ncbi:MAG: amidohydrolase [Bacteroidales bacterium]|nr:amidohydrolase [Bacteroidales bacterium]
MKQAIFFISVSLIIMSSCTIQKKQADLIVHNAKVYTVDDAFAIQQAFAVKDGKFVAVGTDKAILGNYDSENIIDADGKSVYPGFIDAHCHFYGYGCNLLKRADLVGTKSFEEVVERLKEHYQKNPSEWIEGRGWDQNDWEIKDFPTKELLDEAFPDNPVYLTRIDGHAAVANSVALKRAGITAETKIAGGDVFVSNGEPTGILIDNAMDLISDIIPQSNEEFDRNALMAAEKNCFPVGLTSIHDAGLSKETVDLIDIMHKEGSLKMRIYAMLSPSENNLNSYVKNGPYTTERLTVQSIKLFADGALGSRGAKMIEPYSDDPDNSGLFMHEPDYYKNICAKAIEHNFQVNTHAIGDEANRFILNLYAEYLNGINDRRWRIEHAQIIHLDDFKLFGEYSIIPSVQPTHATSDMYWAEDRVGAERIEGAYAYQQLLDQNDWLPLGTDFPVENINPLYTFYAAIARKDLKGWPEEGFQINNALSREDALRGMTIWAAKAAFEEDVKGSIEAGKFADFVILDEDIMISEIEIVPNVKVIATFSGGEQVFKSE